MLSSAAVTLLAFNAFVSVDACDMGPNKHEWGPRKTTVMLPMEDGVKLHTELFFPVAKHNLEDGKYSAIVDRSPYGYCDMEWITDIFLPFGFVAVGQDMRGTELSEGNFTMWHTDTADAASLGDWIVKQPWSNGKIYTFGASADGLASYQYPAAKRDWLKGQYIAWSPASLYDVLYPSGTYKQETTEDWLMGLTMPNPEVALENIQTAHEHETNDLFWQEIELSERNGKFADVKAPSAFWGGWYDLFISGTINGWDGYNRLSDPSVRGQSVITIDPCGHCLETQDFFSENVVMGRTAIALGQMFELFGIHDVIRGGIKNVTYYVMSSNDDAGKEAGQYWTSVEEFPKPVMTNFYFHADKTASLKPALDSDSESTTYVFDPANPQLTMGGNNLPPSIGGSIPCGPLDQAEQDIRSDVVNFQTELFDHAFHMTGGLYATLFVGSDAIDTDFMVRISDVYPDGQVLLIQDNAVRMRWREGGPEPRYLEKDKVYKVEMNLWNTSFVVAPGHALRFSISSSNNPRFSVNPQNGLLLADPAYPGENVTANNAIYHSARYPSHVSLPMVTKLQQPVIDVMEDVQTRYPKITNELVLKMSKYIKGMINNKAGKK